MSALKSGDSFPEGINFTYVPASPEKQEITACGLPVKYDASKEFKNQKIILVAVPGAFTPTCQEKHITTYLASIDQLKSKGVDHVVVISGNDHWVMSAWGKANGVHDDFILFMSDDDVAFSKSLGWANGSRPARYAIIVDNGKITYAEKDVPKSVAVSEAKAVLAKL